MAALGQTGFAIVAVTVVAASPEIYRKQFYRRIQNHNLPHYPLRQDRTEGLH